VAVWLSYKINEVTVLGLVCSWWVSKPSRYVTSRPGQLSLSVPLSMGIVSYSSKHWGVKRHPYMMH